MKALFLMAALLTGCAHSPPPDPSLRRVEWLAGAEKGPAWMCSDQIKPGWISCIPFSLACKRAIQKMDRDRLDEIRLQETIEP